MNSASVSFSYRAGETVRLSFAVTDQALAPVSISGMTIRFVLGRSPSTIVASTEISPATAVVTVTNPSGGIYQVVIEPETTDGLAGTYRFESWLEDSSGNKSEPARGYITFHRSLLETAGSP